MSFVFVGLRAFIYFTLSPHAAQYKGIYTSTLVRHGSENFLANIFPKANKRNIKILVKTKTDKIKKNFMIKQKKKHERCRNIVIRIIYALSPDGDPILIDNVEDGWSVAYILWGRLARLYK